jgi:hypothetical protein
MTDSIIQIKRSSNTAQPTSLANGELAYSYQSNSLFIGDPAGTFFKVLDTGAVGTKLSHVNGVLTNSAALVTNATGYVDNFKTLNLTSDGTQTANVINAQDISIANTLTVNGDIILRGSSLQLGDGGDTISLGASVNSHIIPAQNSALVLGDASNRWLNLYTNTVTLSADPTTAMQAVTKQYVDNIEAQLGGNSIIIGPPTDGAFANGKGSTGEGAAIGLANTTKISDSIDVLNETMYNVFTNNYVRDVTVTCTSGNTGGTPLTATLTLDVTGNATHFDVEWGDGSFSNNTTDSTPSHTYTDNSNSPFDVTVIARNPNAKGSGNTATHSVTDLITLYTSNPGAAFQIYDASSGGNIITEANINQTIYILNTSTNSNGVVATFHANWGDGNSDAIANTTVAGGTEGARLSHAYTTGTGTGSNTIAFSINTHATADPSVLPTASQSTLKIFNTAIAAPNGLSSKNITLTTGSTGSDVKVAHGFIDHSSGVTTLSAGDSCTRYINAGTRTTSGTANSTPFYNGIAGTLKAFVDGSEDGSITLTTGNNVGTSGGLDLHADVDFYNFDASGSSVSAAQRTFAPGLYHGLKAKISKSTLSPGAHTYKLSHSATGNTAVVQFVEDSLTGTPVINCVSTTVTQNSAGTLAYVSGIPYYTNDAVLNVAGVLMSNVAGQTYRNTTSPFQIVSGTNTESDSGGAINSQSKTYSQIIPSALLNGGYPKANTGLTANVTLETFQVTVAGGGRNVEGLGLYGKNVNGNGTTLQMANTQIQAYNGNSSGVNETAISVADALGAGFDDDGKRIKVSWSGATPAFSNSTNYYTGNAWTGSQTIAGTDEAVVRFGTLKHYTTNLSTGFLPVGPNLNTGRSGRQYFTFAFRRTTMANFNLTMSGKVSTMHIAAPNTAIDSTSDSNGWLNCGSTYGGAGTPGANTTAGGNGSDGCAFNAGDVVADGTTYSNKEFTFTLGDQNATGAFGNQILVRIGLDSGDSITSMSID